MTQDTWHCVWCLVGSKSGRQEKSAAENTQHLNAGKINAWDQKPCGRRLAHWNGELRKGGQRHQGEVREECAAKQGTGDGE